MTDAAKTALQLDVTPIFADRAGLPKIRSPTSPSIFEKQFRSLLCCLKHQINFLFTDRVKPMTAGRWPNRRVPGLILGQHRRHHCGPPAAGCACRELHGPAGGSGAWQDRLPHCKMDFPPSAGAGIQSEYLVVRGHAATSIRALRGISARLALLLQVSEMRSVAADSLRLSASCERDSVAFPLTWIRDQAAVEAAVRLVEEALASCAARPHRGKVFAAGAAELVPPSWCRCTPV